MKKSLIPLTAAVATALVWGLTAAPAQSVTTAGVTTQATAVSASGDLTEAQSREAYAKLLALLPSDYQARAAATWRRAGQDADGGAADQVINPNDYKCATTPLRTWLAQQTAGWTAIDAGNANVGALLLLADALYLPGAGTERFGVDGEFTIPVTHSFQDLRSFWDIPGQGIGLRAMHGAMLLDKPRVIRAVQLLFGLNDQSAAAFADLVAFVFDQDRFDHGDHPALTFNAFAYKGGDDIPGLGVTAPRIVMGDGIQAGMKAVGLSDVASRAILAHEYGHQAQYANGQDASTLTGPEASRRLELMADAYAAYHLTHARGAAMNWIRVRQFEVTFSEVGDCNFAGASHHGTPAQRIRAAEWGHDLAEDAQKQGHILSSVTFGRLFDQALPSLVAPDAG